MSAADETGPWAPRPPNRPRSDLPSIAVVGGTGRMGVHLCAAWANAGYHVTLCSRHAAKAQDIVTELLSGQGYPKKVTGANAGQGDYCVMRKSGICRRVITRRPPRRISLF